MRKRFVQIAGWALLALSLFYLGRTAAGHIQEIPTIAWTAGTILVIVFGVALYVGAILIWGAGWVVLLRAVGNKSGWLTGFIVIGISQIAKYVPGNIVHHFGRVALSNSYGWRPSRVVLTMALEMCWLIAASSACAILALALSDARGPADIYNLSTQNVALLMFAAMALPLVVLFGLRLWGSHLVGVPSEPGELQLPDTVTSLLNFLSHFVNFLLQGAILVLLASVLIDVPFDSYWLATGAFALAWVVGFIAPGVPAGLGVREAILVTGLALDTSMGSAIALAAGHRAVTIIGDAVVLAIALALRRLLAVEGIHDR